MRTSFLVSLVVLALALPCPAADWTYLQPAVSASSWVSVNADEPVSPTKAHLEYVAIWHGSISGQPLVAIQYDLGEWGGQFRDAGNMVVEWELYGLLNIMRFARSYDVEAGYYDISQTRPIWTDGRLLLRRPGWGLSEFGVVEINWNLDYVALDAGMLTMRIRFEEFPLAAVFEGAYVDVAGEIDVKVPVVR